MAIDAKLLADEILKIPPPTGIGQVHVLFVDDYLNKRNSELPPYKQDTNALKIMGCEVVLHSQVYCEPGEKDWYRWQISINQ